MRGDNPERGPEDRSREGEDDGLRLVDPGHCGGRGPKTPEGRDLPRTRMDLKAHRRVDEEADHHGDDEREQRERRLDLRDAAADKADRAERLKSRQPQCSDDCRVRRCVCQNRLHRPAPRCVHGDQEIRPDVDPIVREERGARRRWGDDREVGEVQPEQTQVPRTRHGPPARGLDLIPQSNVDGDIARTDREPDGSDPRVIRFEGDGEYGERETIDLEARGMGPHRDEVAAHVGERGRIDRTREQLVPLDVYGRAGPDPDRDGPDAVREGGDRRTDHLELIRGLVHHFGRVAEGLFEYHDFGFPREVIRRHIDTIEADLGRLRASGGLDDLGLPEESLAGQVRGIWNSKKNLRYAAGALMISNRFRQETRPENRLRASRLKVVYEAFLDTIDDAIDSGDYNFGDALDLMRHCLGSLTAPRFDGSRSRAA